MKKEKNVSKKTESNTKTSWIRFFLSVAVLFGIGYVIFNYVPFIAKYNHYVIVSGSMEPVIMTYDVVIIDTSVNVDDLNPDDIIAFHTTVDGNEIIVVHYIYSITEENGETKILTYSEKTTLDEWVLSGDDVIGIYKYTIPNIGRMVLFLESTIGKIVLVGDLLIIYIIVDVFFDSDKKKKDSIKEIEESSENKE